MAMPDYQITDLNVPENILLHELRTANETVGHDLGHQPLKSLTKNHYDDFFLRHE